MSKTPLLTSLSATSILSFKMSKNHQIRNTPTSQKIQDNNVKSKKTQTIKDYLIARNASRQFHVSGIGHVLIPQTNKMRLNTL